MTRRRNGGNRPHSRRECRSLIAVETLARIVQHMQPDCSITIVSSMRSSRRMVETDFTEFVDQHSSVGQGRIEQQPLQQGRLARAEKSR